MEIKNYYAQYYKIIKVHLINQVYPMDFNFKNKKVIKKNINLNYSFILKIDGFGETFDFVLEKKLIVSKLIS